MMGILGRENNFKEYYFVFFNYLCIIFYKLLVLLLDTLSYSSSIRCNAVAWPCHDLRTKLLSRLVARDPRSALQVAACVAVAVAVTVAVGIDHSNKVSHTIRLHFGICQLSCRRRRSARCRGMGNVWGRGKGSTGRSRSETVAASTA